MITLSSKKFETENQNQKYHCKICDYYGIRKSQYDRHMKSKKHLKKAIKLLQWYQRWQEKQMNL